MEEVVTEPGSRAAFWRDRAVLVTGHTGFKGGWLAHWLSLSGAEVHGFALDPQGPVSLFASAGVAGVLATDMRGDLRDYADVAQVVGRVRPSVVIHLAAQPLVRESYRDPVATLATNLMGTVNLLEAVRGCDSVAAVLVVTTDKVYDHRGERHAFVEDDPLGGFDVYSASKASTELVSSAYSDSFLAPAGIALATARSGNVIGGGDWAQERLIPDAFRALAEGGTLEIRHPEAVRPWQHVLEPLCGYLRLAERLVTQPSEAPRAVNFGPDPTDFSTVESIVRRIVERTGVKVHRREITERSMPEAEFLVLDSGLARETLDWRPRWNLEEAIDATTEWYLADAQGADMNAITREQIRRYERSSSVGT